MKTIIRSTIIFLLLFTTEIFPQQLPRFSQYMMNEFIINPAIAGFDGRTTLNLTARKEWLGFGNNVPTPQTFSFSAQTRVLRKQYVIKNGFFGRNVRSSSKGRVGLGANMFSDNNGAINRTGAQFTYAYHIYTRNTQLSLGLTGMAVQFKINPRYAEFKEPEDPLSNLIGQSKITPDAAIGINYMTHNSHVGFSACNLFQTRIRLGNNSDISFKRNYYIISSYRYIFWDSRWEIEPSAIVSGNELFQLTADVSMNVLYKREYWGGLSFRTVGDFIIFMGIKLKDYYFTYSFDFGFNGVMRYTYGSHEITLSAKFGDSSRRYRWLQRY